MVGEANAEALGPGSSSSDLALTRLTSTVIFNERPSSMGVTTFVASSVRSCFQFAEIVGLSLGGVVVRVTCQSLCGDWWLGTVRCGFGEFSTCGVFTGGRGVEMLNEPTDDRLFTDSVDVLLSTGFCFGIEYTLWSLISD